LIELNDEKEVSRNLQIGHALAYSRNKSTFRIIFFKKLKKLVN
jgi:hypothetical protein